MGSQRHRVGKTSTFLHISPLILAWVSPQEIQCTRPFVLNFHWMFLGKDVCSRRPSPMASKCPIHGKSILRSHQLEPQIAAGIMEPPKGTRRIQMGWTPTRSLRTTGTHLYSASGFSLSRGQGDRGGARIHPSANSSNSNLTGTCMHPEKRDVFADFTRTAVGAVWWWSLQSELAKVSRYHEEWQTVYTSFPGCSWSRQIHTERREVAQSSEEWEC